MSFEVPILLIAWRRPHTLRQVINAIRPVAPINIYVACDGPSPDRPGEDLKVRAVRKVIEDEINWPCSIERLYSNFNQGCKIGVSKAISWFFSRVEEGIILEDDCLPHPAFFEYCKVLLERYRDDTRVWCISGNNFYDRLVRGTASYYFQQIPMIWGWATWRRRWDYYDPEISRFNLLKNYNHLQGVFSCKREYYYWMSIWKRLHSCGEPDTWDYQWVFACISNGGLTATPNTNLVSNIGFGDDALHTTQYRVPRKTKGFSVESICHPPYVLADIAASKLIYDNHFGGKYQVFPWCLMTFFRKIISCLRRLAKLCGKT